MRMEAFTVFDSAARRYLEPFFAESIEVACRMFRTVVNKAGHQFNQFPEDYTLFHVGAFDQASGVFEPLVAPHSCGVAVMFVQAQQQGPQIVREA